ncbi:MAG TPA: ABC transporter permease [Gammaproteobacteria bacterium]|nr:ABC transporter permease [Gammaproteobacteria bacterium]
MSGLGKDLRFALRQLAASPGFMVAAVLTLALGIGANTAMFSVLNGYLLKPLPYPHSERLVAINTTTPKFAPYNLGLSQPMYTAMHGHLPALASMGLYTYGQFSLQSGARARRIDAISVTGSVWRVLRVQPLLGHLFTNAASQPGAGKIAVISYHLWRNAFGADATIIGKSINLSGKRYRVVAVMPAGFVFKKRRADLWVPLTFGAVDLSANKMYHTGTSLIGRLAPGASAGKLHQQLRRISGRIKRIAPPTGAFQGFYFVTRPYRQTLLYGKTEMLLLLQGAVLLVLLIACINIANLLLSRIMARSHEMAMRSALGATRGVLARQLLIEGFCLAVPGAIVGLFFGWASLRLLRDSVLSPAAGGVFDITMDWRVGLVALAAASVAAVLASLLPIRYLIRLDLQTLLQEGGQGMAGGHRARRASGFLVVAEVALATVLLAGAGLLLHSFINLQNIDTGFDGDHVMTASLLPPTSAQANDAQLAVIYSDLVARVRALPGTQFAAVATTSPFGQWFHVGHARPRKYDSARGQYGPQVILSAIHGDYFKALEVPLLAGRYFDPHDTAKGRPVAIIGRRLARKLFGDNSAIGKQITLGGTGGVAEWLTIVGIVPPVRMTNLQGEPGYNVYLSALQFPGRPADIVVRTSVQRGVMSRSLPRVAAQVDSRTAVFNIEPMHQRLAERLSDRQATLLLVVAFGGIALLLAAVGIYGVLSHAVRQRVSECGVRLALGALPGDLLRMVIKDCMALIAIGLCVGLVTVAILGFVLSSQLFGVRPYDPPSLAGTAVALFAVALFACYLPARRAARLDPVEALHSEG